MMMPPAEQPVAAEPPVVQAEPERNVKTAMCKMVTPGLHLLSTALYASGYGLLIADFVMHTEQAQHSHSGHLTTQVPPSSPAPPENSGYDTVSSAVELTVRGFLLIFMAVATAVSLRLYYKGLQWDFPRAASYVYFIIGMAGFILDIFILASAAHDPISSGGTLAAEACAGSILCIVASAIIVIIGMIVCKAISNISMGRVPGDNERLIPRTGEPNYGTIVLPEPCDPTNERAGAQQDPNPECSSQQESLLKGPQEQGTAQKEGKHGSQEELDQGEGKQQCPEHQDPLRQGTSAEDVVVPMVSEHGAGEDPDQQQQHQQQDQQQQGDGGDGNGQEPEASDG